VNATEGDGTEGDGSQADATTRDLAADALEAAHRAALSWLGTLADRPVPAQASIDDVIADLGPTLPERSRLPAETVELLARAGEPGLVAMPSGRFFGFVIGGTHPAALAADWLTSAWDQNSGLRDLTPTHTAIEDIASAWLLDLLGLPAQSAVGFTTGATAANFTALTTARDEVLRRVGWDITRHGLAGGPAIRVLVGEERHDTIDIVLRYAGLGEPETLAVDGQGLVIPDALATALQGDDRPTMVVLQAGNIHSGGSDPFGPLITTAHEHGAWVHIDGAFGLWAAASPTHRHLVQGVEAADSWTTDAHKTLNVPYDCGIVVVREPAALQAAMGMTGAYLIRDTAVQPLDKVPELSRRGRAVPVWAVLHCLGREGVHALVDRLVGHARALADAMADIPGARVCNDVVFTQVCVTFGSDEVTRDVVRLLFEDGTTWMTGSTWHGHAVLRISVSNWSTTDDDVRRSVEAVKRAAARVREHGVTAEQGAAAEQV
jgi:glutamate/tyrosine decarboxylase-like PLP-dependent enzyme